MSSKFNTFFLERVLVKKIILLIVCQLLIALSAYSQNNDEYAPRKCATFSAKVKQMQEERRQRKSDYPLEHPQREYDSLPFKISSPKGYFRVHYTLDGIDAVSNIDNNRNGIPDYIDSVAYYFDHAYEFEVNILNFNPPPSDVDGGGTPEYDVYVADMMSRGNSYGYTTQEGDFPINIPGKITGSMSYIVIDNNYSPTDSYFDTESGKLEKYQTTGIDAVKITAAHEFHHAIQFGYGQTRIWNAALNEMASVFMEYRIFPEVKDFFSYIRRMFKDLPAHSFTNPDPTFGYAWSAFFIKLYEETKNDQIVLDVWENISNGMQSFEAIEASLHKHLNSSINEQLKEIADWFYYTGKRSKTGKYFSFASELPELTFKYNEYYSYPSVMQSAEIMPDTYYPICVLFNVQKGMAGDTLDLLMYNQDTPNNNASYQIAKEFNISISESKDFCDSLIMNGDLCYRSAVNQDIMLPIFYEYTGKSINEHDYAFPLPYTENDEFIAFPVPSNYDILEKCVLTIFDTENREIFKTNSKVGVYEQRRIVLWQDIPGDIGNGVYMYQITFKDNKTKLGKFVVKKGTN